MKNLLKTFKPYDYIIVLLAVIISFIPALVSSSALSKQNEHPSQLVALVRIDGEIVDELPLSDGAPSQTTIYHPHEGQYNIIETQGLRARIQEDNSPDQIGVMTGWIHRPGQTAICLPHGLVLEIQGQTEENDDLVLPL